MILLLPESGLHEQADLRIEGRILGFDEYMNLVVDDAEEIQVKKIKFI